MPSAQQQAADTQLLRCEAMKVFLTEDNNFIQLAIWMYEQHKWDYGYTAWIFLHIDDVEALQIGLNADTSPILHSEAVKFFYTLIQQLDYETLLFVCTHYWQRGSEVSETEDDFAAWEICRHVNVLAKCDEEATCDVYCGELDELYEFGLLSTNCVTLLWMLGTNVMERVVEKQLEEYRSAEDSEEIVVTADGKFEFLRDVCD